MPHATGRQTVRAVGLQAPLFLHEIMYLREEPPVDSGEPGHFLEFKSVPEGIGDVPDALCARHAKFPLQRFQLFSGAYFPANGVEPVGPSFKPAQRFLQRLLEGTPDGHDFADGLHLRGEPVVGLGKFLEGEPGHLCDHIVDARFEGRRRCAPGDLVAQLVQRVAHRQFRRHLGDGEPGRLGGQRRRTGYAGIHFDDDQAAVFRVHGELHVRTARIHADLAQHVDGGVAHQLVFLVGQRLRRRHGDGIAGVNPHGVEVFDGTDDDAVVVVVPDHFHLELFPAQHRLFQQDFGGRGLVQAAGDDFLELLAVVGDPPAAAAERERRPHDGREADFSLDLPGPLEVLRHVRLRDFESDFAHGIAKALAVFGHVDGVAGGADQFHAVFRKHPVANEVERAVQTRLSPHGGQQGVGPFPLDDALQRAPVNRLNVDCVGA